MKKLFWVLFFVLFFVVNSFGAWVCVESRKVYEAKASVIITVSCTTDGSAEEYEITDYISDARGKYLYSMSTVAATTDTFDLDVNDNDDFALVETTANTNSGKAWHLGNVTLGQYPMIKDFFSLVFGDPGPASETIVVDLFFAGVAKP